MLSGFNVEKMYQYLLIALAFLLPLTVFGANLVIVTICLLWIFSGNYKSKFLEIVSNKLVVASILFFLLHLMGLLWTENISWGLHMLHKMWYFVGLYPILFTIVKKENIYTYIFAFLLAISVTEVFSYLIWFELIEPFKNATVRNPIPFMSHISYNPILAFAIYLVLHQIVFNKKMSNIKVTLMSFFVITMIINMFITGGRAGQVIFFVMLIIFSFQVFYKQKLKAFILICMAFPLIFFSAYQSSEIFKDRFDDAMNDVVTFQQNSNTSVGMRILFFSNSLELFKNNPIIGVGTGDFVNEYFKVSAVNTPTFPLTTNPHNMYILILSQLGLIGLLSMLSIFYYQVKLSFNSPNKLIRDTGLMLPVIFLVLMMSDSYLLGHYTTLLFIFFSSFLYKNFEDS
jgi:O-antigen ligase